MSFGLVLINENAMN